METTTSVLMSMPRYVLEDLDALARERVQGLGSAPNRSETVRFLLAEYRRKKTQKKAPTVLDSTI